MFGALAMSTSAVRAPCAASEAYFEKIVVSSRSDSVTLIQGYFRLNFSTNALKFAAGGFPYTTRPDSPLDFLINWASEYFGFGFAPAVSVRELADVAATNAAAAIRVSTIATRDFDTIFTLSPPSLEPARAAGIVKERRTSANDFQRSLRFIPL